jgi:hypothetical protein
MAKVVPVDAPAVRGQLCVVEFEESSTFDPKRGWVRALCYQPAIVTSVTRDGLVQAVERHLYGGKVATKVKHLFGYRCCHMVSLKVLPKDQVEAVLDLLDQCSVGGSMWHTIEAARADVRAAIGLPEQRDAA